MVVAMSSAAPLDPSMESVSVAKSSSDAFTSASMALMASWPAIAAAACACCSAVMPENASRSSPISWLSGFISPVDVVADMPRSASTLAAFCVGETMLVSIARSDVPACSPLMPLFASTPIATAQSSTL